jgi:long-chain acyl-CoA synthetase
VTANLAELLARTATSSGEACALVDAASGRRVSWRELDESVDRVATALRDRGARPGQRVALTLRNTPEFVISYYAALRARLVVVPVNPRGTTGELVRVLGDSGASLVIADGTTVTAARSAVAGIQDALVGADAELLERAVVPRVVVTGAPTLPDEIAFDTLLAAEPVVFPAATDPEALAVLLYTSGTSGRPRAAMLTHRALIANIEQTRAVEPPIVTHDDVVLAVLPMFHVYGLNAVLGLAVSLGATLVLQDGFDIEGTLDLIGQERVSVVPVAPAVFAYWRGVDDVAQRLASVRIMISGSAPLDPGLVREFEGRAGLEVHQGYGLTEAAPIVTSTLGSASLKPSSVGRALPGVEVRLVDDAGLEPEGDDPGEIAVRGANLFSGYWPDGDEGPDADGWYRTGDVGYLDDDGDLFLVDRLKELIIVSGFNVYPTEVEDAISEISGVAEVAVVGEPDPATGERVIAYVRPRAATTASFEELAEEIRAHCLARLAGFKRPKEIVVAQELPRTVTGKVAKGRLREARRRANMGLVE